MRTTDSHCHLTDPRLLEQIDAVVQRARSAGVWPLVTIGCGPDDGERAIELAARFDDVYATVAVHPHDAKGYSPALLERVEGLLSSPKVVAVGEIGLDYHYDFAPRQAQQASFEAQLRLAGRLDRPVVIHSRESIGDALEIIGRVRADGVPVRGVFHSFTGTAAEADAVLAAGLFISLSGIVTFRKAAGLQAAAGRVPPDRLLIETDAPYLSPEPMRSRKVNEPALLVHTRRFLAGLLGWDESELAERTAANAAALFAFD